MKETKEESEKRIKEVKEIIARKEAVWNKLPKEKKIRYCVSCKKEKEFTFHGLYIKQCKECVEMINGLF